MQLYKDVLTTAWRQTIHQPRLWLFGLFAIFIFGNGGEIDRYLRLMNAIITEGHILNPQFWLEQRWVTTAVRLNALLAQGDLATWVFVVASIGALVCLLIMMSISVGALIAAAKKPTLSFVEAFRAGQKHWVDLFFLFISGTAVIAMATFLVGAIIFASGLATEQAQQVFVLISSLGFIPLVIVLSFIVRFAANSIVLDNCHLLAGLRQAWRVFSSHWLVTLEMAIVNFVVVFLVNIALLFSVGILFTPQYATALTLSAGNFFERLSTAIVTSGLAYVGLTILVGAIVSTWQWAAWTLLFERLRQEKPTSTLLRWLHRRRST